MTISATGHTAMEYRKRICAAMNYISQNLGRDLSLKEIAGSAAFSSFHFHRIFKAVVGETVSEFTRRLRLEWAANRLLSTNESVTVIAMDCRFSSSQNFAKAFHHAFGMSPSEYRKSKAGNMVSKEVNAMSLAARYNPESLPIDLLLNKGGSTMNADIRELPEYNVAYVRKIGPYGQETCEHAFGELAQWAGPRGYLATGPLFGLYWDNPEITPPDKCRTDACIGVPHGTGTDGQVATQTIKGGPHAVCRFETGPDGFQKAWEDAFVWLVSNGYECDDRPCYELYHNNPGEHPEGKWIFDICIPLKVK